MSLTIGETAFLAPAGVILGAAVSYTAQRRTSRDATKLTQANFVAQRSLPLTNNYGIGVQICTRDAGDVDGASVDELPFVISGGDRAIAA